MHGVFQLEIPCNLHTCAYIHYSMYYPRDTDSVFVKNTNVMLQMHIAHAEYIPTWLVDIKRHSRSTAKHTYL